MSEDEILKEPEIYEDEECDEWEDLKIDSYMDEQRGVND